MLSVSELYCLSGTTASGAGGAVGGLGGEEVSDVAISIVISPVVGGGCGGSVSVVWSDVGAKHHR